MAESKISKVQIPEQIYVNMDGTNRRMYVKHGTLSINHNSPTAVTFPSAFPSACIHVALTCSQLNFGGASTISVGDISKTGFKLSNRNATEAAMTIGWVAFGY